MFPLKKQSELNILALLCCVVGFWPTSTIMDIDFLSWSLLTAQWTESTILVIKRPTDLNYIFFLRAKKRIQVHYTSIYFDVFGSGYFMKAVTLSRNGREGKRNVFDSN
jgi:hypothetical protein